MNRGWREQLRQAGEMLGEGRNVEAFQRAFGALEACYYVAAKERRFEASTYEEDKFSKVTEFLARQQYISEGDAFLARHLARARNVVAHKYGFEPSTAKVYKTIHHVNQLCARFGTKVSDIMTTPVRMARPDQPVGELISAIVADGISQFPVAAEGQVVGTLTENHVFRAWEKGEGILDPATPVKDLMDQTPLPAIDPDADLDTARDRLQSAQVPALLVFEHARPVGIITKYDLLSRLFK
jgi:predicted transcriptional regulator